jgi:hypothetical protein
VKKALRQTGLAARYDITVRSIQRMRQDGRLPAPDFWLGAFPMWWEETIERNERARFLCAPPPKTFTKPDAA